MRSRVRLLGLVLIVALGLSGCAIRSPAIDAVTTGPTASAGRDAPLAVFIGDSITAGATLPSRHSRWSTIVSARFGWDEVNLAASGTGFAVSSATDPNLECEYYVCRSFADQASRAMAERPDIVFLAGGINDALGSKADADVLFGVEETMDAICDAAGDTTIVIIGPLSVRGDPTGVLTRIDRMISTSLACQAILIPDAFDWIGDDPALRAADGVHPTAKGQAVIADRITELLEADGFARQGDS